MPTDGKLRCGAAWRILFILIFMAALPFQVRAQNLYLPTLGSGNGSDLEIVLANTAFVEAQVTITARNYQGAVIQGDAINNPVMLSMSASSQRSLRTTEIFGAGISLETGWLEISPSIPGVTGSYFIFEKGGRAGDGAELESEPSGRLIFSRITAAATDSVVQWTLVNVSSETLHASVSLFESSGLLVAVRNFDIPAFFGSSNLLEELASLNPGFNGYAVVSAESDTAPASLVGLITHRGRSDLALLRALPESRKAAAAWLPHLVSQAGYVSSLVLINPTDDPQTVHIRAEALTINGISSGSSPIVAERTLAPHHRFEERADQLFGFAGDALITASLSFQTLDQASGVIGFLSYSAAEGDVLSAVEAQVKGQLSFLLSNSAKHAGQYTGLALVNPNEESVDVTLEPFSAASSSAASAVLSLAPGERHAALLQEYFGTRISNIQGVLHVRATSPILATELFAAENAELSLANAPVLKLSRTDEPVVSSASATGPQLSSMSPAKGATGTVVAVSGSGFSTSLNQNAVVFTASKGKGAINATVLTASPTYLTVGVPSGAVTGPVYVKIGNVKSNSVNFTVVTNQSPTVSAGSNQTITLPSNAFLSGTATDDGFINGTLNTTWSFVSGPGSVTFATSINTMSGASGQPLTLTPTTAAVFSAAGTYDVRLTASDGQFTVSSDVIITVNSGATNQPPMVIAGSNQTITLPATATLTGSATDDGVPSGSPLNNTWSQVSGPAAAAIADAGSLTTAVSFPSPGTYVFRLSASDGALTSTADVTITVNDCGGIVSGTVTVAAAVSSSKNINGVQFQLDGVNVGQPLTVAPYSMPWSTATAPNGCHVWKAIATDSMGQQGVATISAIISN